VYGARAEDINLYSHKMIIYPGHCNTRAEGPLTGDGTLAQVTFGNSTARFEQEPFPSPTQNLGKRRATEPSSLPSMLSGMTMSAPSTIASVALIFVSHCNV
jgi:hypothetical protein